MKEVETFAVGDRIKWLDVLPGMEPMPGLIIAPFMRWKELEQATCRDEKHANESKGTIYPIWTVQFDEGWIRSACCQSCMVKL